MYYNSSSFWSLVPADPPRTSWLSSWVLLSFRKTTTCRCSALSDEGESDEFVAETFSIDTDCSGRVSEVAAAIDIFWVCDCSTGIYRIQSSIAVNSELES